jgi:hypothetical protein
MPFFKHILKLTALAAGTGTSYAQRVGDRNPWPLHHIDRQYYNHNSLTPGDVNGDGLDDYAVVHETGKWA